MPREPAGLRLCAAVLCAASALGACSTPPAAGVPASSSVAAVAPATSATSAVPSATVGAPAVLPKAPADTSLRPRDAEKILFPVPPPGSPAPLGACEGIGPPAEQIRCLLRYRYEEDPEAAALALDLYEATGWVAGVDEDHIMDGGYRGKLHLVPDLPVGPRRRHLVWLRDAAADHDAFFRDLVQKGRATPGHDGQSTRPRYRWRNLGVRFFRSVNARTPSAYAGDWTLAYNVAGSLNTSATAVRETLFHEIFHLNDADHGGFSQRALGGIYDAIVARCGRSTPCLRPYSPGDTMVKGGTYYAFQPGNDVGEYAAELAMRYYREERAALRGEAPAREPFRCGPGENRRAWELLIEEFFGGLDVLPPCGG